MATPLYVDPNTVHTPTTGTSPPASWGTIVRADLEHLIRPPMVIGMFDLAAPQTVPDATYTAVIFEEADAHDTDAMHSPSVDPNRFYAASGLGGWYSCEALVQWETVPELEGAVLEMYLRINGSSSIVIDQRVGLGRRTVCFGSQTMKVTGTDYLELVVVHDAGVDLDIISGNLAMRKVSNV
jgi:hypothetical protein